MSSKKPSDSTRNVFVNKTLYKLEFCTEGSEVAPSPFPSSDNNGRAPASQSEELCGRGVGCEVKPHQTKRQVADRFKTTSREQSIVYKLLKILAISIV